MRPPHPDRRTFLADAGLGFAGLAAGALLWRDGVARAAGPGPPSGKPLFAPKAKSVIWVFLSGGYSHVETFDPKPALNKYAGKTFDQTPLANPLKSPLHDKRSRSVVADSINVRDKINAGKLPGPTLYVSGPFIQKAPYPGTEQFRWGVNGPQDARAKVAKLADAGVNCIKLIDQDQMSQAEVHGTEAKLVTDGPSRKFHVRIEVPRRSDLYVRLTAGDLALRGIEGDKDVELHAGELDIDVVRPEDYRRVEATVWAGELQAAPFNVMKEGLFRSFTASGQGKYRFRAHLKAGELRLSSSGTSLK